MTMRKKRRLLHLERLLGKKVYDSNGQLAGKIEEIRAQRAGDKLLIQEYILGRAGLLQRLSIPAISTLLLTFLGARSGAHSHNHKVRWDELDLSDISHPRMKVSREQLTPVDAE
jgi:hypothetical protein